MKIIKGCPPNFKLIKKKFNPPINVVFSYGNVIYSPSGNSIPQHLIIHEKTHANQQKNNPEDWWKKYIEDPQFRLGQEIEAYKNQFQYYKKINKSWMPFLKKITSDLSGSVYGNIISYKDAMSKILY